MTDYVVMIHLGEADAPVRVALTDCSPEDAEVRRREIATEIEHAVEIEAPLIYTEATPDDPTAGVPIDPARVTRVDLISALDEA
jgi:hypothetical protein